MYKKGIYEIRSNEPLTDAVWRMVLEGDTQWITAPGQFVNIALEGRYLRRPISVCDYDAGTLTLVYKVVGGGTEQMSRMRPGQRLDLLTGLGNGFMLRDDFNSRTLISLPGDEKPFYTATGGYSWANDKPWIQNRTYRLDVKVKVDGYNISVYVRTGESLKNGKNWTAVFPDDKPINVYDWYNSSDAAQTGIRSQYLSTLYSLDGRCHFGITARRDNGHTDDIAFSGIWYIINER